MGTTSVLFVATDRDRCATAARLIEAVDDGVEAAGATCAAGVRTALTEADVDAVVFGENPLTTDGTQLLEVVELCEEYGTGGDSIPVVLFTDGSYGPSTAKATEGVTDYVRADGEDAYAHLVDRVRWATADAEEDDAAWYESLVESMEDGVLMFDRSCRIRYANGAMSDVFGVEADYEDTPVEALYTDGPVPEGGVDAIRAAVESVLAGDADSLSPEVTVEPAGGEPRVVEFQVVALPGGREGALATVRNVTEYRQTESALRETRSKIERLHAITNEMGSVRSERELFELTVDAADRILALDVCGIDVVEDERFVPRATLGADYGPAPVEGIAGRAFHTGESILVEDARDREANSPVEGARAVLAVPVENTGVLRAVSHDPGAFDERDRDLAELLVAHVGETLTRVRVGETLRERERDLVEERERLVSLFENVPSPVVSYAFEDGDPVIRDANPSFESVFGVDADRVVGDPLREHVRPPSGDPDAVADHDFINDLDDLDAQLAAGRELETAVRRETADGPRDFLLHAGPLVDAERGEEGYVIYTDISVQKDRERELERHSERLEALADVATGDLREHLNEARAYFELAVETGEEDDLAVVRRAHERISRLVDDLETLAEGNRTADPEPVDLQTAATRAWASVETGAIDFDVEDATVEADPDRLDDLLQQLVRNVVDHAVPGSDPLAGDLETDAGVEVRIGPLPDRPGFFLEDTGVGIPAADRDRVFETGYSTDDAPGLGMGVVREVAEDHGWTVRVAESAEGGARLEFITGVEATRRHRHRARELYTD